MQIKDNIITISSSRCPQRRDEVAILETFASVIKTAVTKRMSSCTRNFEKHIAKLTYISEEHCEYIREDGNNNWYEYLQLDEIYNMCKNSDNSLFYITFVLQNCFA